MKGGVAGSGIRVGYLLRAIRSDLSAFLASDSPGGHPSFGKAATSP